ncbi:MAG: TonB-dependent receptor [Calditrichaeota bacterium]|nr:MAG: TonB-dependent receptor [Calditrichota bacterium]MBL1208113.1 TonB-dependent receptor [Calditrichota bacterium]
MISYLMFFFLLTGLAFSGDTGKISGTIIGTDVNEGLIGANVVIESIWQNENEIELENKIGAATDVNGEFYILNIRPGIYNISCSYIGYKTELRTKVQIFVDKTTRMDFALEPDVMQSEEITVTAYKEEEVEVDVTATKQVYDISNVESIAGVTDIGSILNLQADVVDDHFRGGRLGESQYILGGGAIVNPINNGRAFNPIVTGLEQVEVYTSGFSAEYGNAQSGVVNMVTKEGTSRWTGRLESSATMPYYKSWGGSPYDPDNLHFYETLLDLEEWLKDNPADPGKPLFDPSYGFLSNYLPERNVWPPDPLTHEDTLHIARLSQIMWLMSMQDVGLDYNDKMDYRLDFSAGGPIHENINFFVAARQNTTYTIVPRTNPDMERQVMMNLVYQAQPENKFKFSFIVDNTVESIFDSNYLRWLFDRSLSVSNYNSVSKQYAMEWKHVYSPSTFMDLKFNILDLSQVEAIELIQDGEFVEDYRDRTNWTDYNRGPSGHFLGKAKDDFSEDKTLTYSFDGSVSKQFNKNNLLKMGIQFSYYDMEIDRKINASSDASYRIVKVSAQPYEGALYVQDKMEFTGMIANLGLRLDFNDLQSRFYSDPFSVSRLPEPDKKTDILLRLQPRIGFSFPVSEKSVFHLNYGTFTQRPSFDQLFFNQATSDGALTEVSGPNLTHEKTQSYDIGFVQAFPLGLRLDVSAYYKDVKDLVETAIYESSDGGKYSTFVNRDYADIKGFHLSLEKNTGPVKAYVRYNFESATGKSSNALDAPVTYFEEADPVEGFVDLPDPEDIFLDYDRTHKLVLNLRYSLPSASGFKVADFYPFENTSISSTYRYVSGRPYTYDTSGQGLKYNKRTPVERDLRIRFQKGFRLNGFNFDFYAEGFNLLNEDWFQYSRTFNSSENTARWHNERNEILIEKDYIPYVTDRSVYLLRNLPRHYRFGLVFKF